MSKKNIFLKEVCIRCERKFDREDITEGMLI